MPDINVDNLVSELRKKMQKAVDAMQHDFAAYRTGKASPALVEGLLVDYYGTQTRLKDIAGITAPEPRLLVIQPWDNNAIPNIEKAIQASELGITPQSDGRVIRLVIPELSEERRVALSKQAKKRAEEAKVAIRNIRREGNDLVKKAQKNGEITEDDQKDMLNDIQKATDEFIEKVTQLCEEKEKEIMTV